MLIDVLTLPHLSHGYGSYGYPLLFLSFRRCCKCVLVIMFLAQSWISLPEAFSDCAFSGVSFQNSKGSREFLIYASDLHIYGPTFDLDVSSCGGGACLSKSSSELAQTPDAYPPAVERSAGSVVVPADGVGTYQAQNGQIGEK